MGTLMILEHKSYGNIENTTEFIIIRHLHKPGKYARSATSCTASAETARG